MEILTKREFAARCKVRPCTVSNWVARKRLTAPALRADGAIAVEAAFQQLGITLDPVRAASRPKAPTAPAAELVAFGPAADLLKARALILQIDAEQRRRAFEHERGRYMLTADAEAQWTAELTDLLLAIDGGFVDLADALPGDRRGRPSSIQKKWGGFRGVLAR